jgi:PAS domain S-box-containing protein
LAAQPDPNGPVIDFERILESAPDAIIVSDARGRIVYANAQTSAMFGYERGELLGRTVETLVPEELRNRHVQHRRQYNKQPKTRPMGLHLDLIARRKDGSRFPVEISLSPMHGGALVTAMVRDVTEHRRLERERERLSAELETERERHRIGMDLHDGIMQAIYAVSLTLELATADIGEDLDDARYQLDRAIDQLHGVVRDIRSYIFDLRPRDYTGDLRSALTNLATEFRQNSQIETFVDISPDIDQISTKAGIAIYHVTHEALSNVRKHAQASSVVIRLEPQRDDICLQISDNGRGFDTTADRSETHRGLRNMNARISAIGGRVEVKSSPGSGTTIIATVPRQQALAGSSPEE